METSSISLIVVNVLIEGPVEFKNHGINLKIEGSIAGVRVGI